MKNKGLRIVTIFAIVLIILMVVACTENIEAESTPRFSRIYSSERDYFGFYTIIRDNETGVNYITTVSYNGDQGGITPLLNSEGKFIVTK